VNWLTVIHEFAHAMDGAERDREKAVWAKAEDVFCAGMRAQYPLRDGGLGKFHFGSETPGVTGTMTPEYKAWLRKHPRPATRKWHASTHAEFVDILAQRVVERGWIASIPAERAARDLARNEKRQQIAAMVSDPAVIRAKKIERRKEQIERLEMRLRRLDATKKAITTRVRSARRSLAALERAASKKEAT
jgi:polyhydroxyalkanoate synthesis regulator phasin